MNEEGRESDPQSMKLMTTAAHMVDTQKVLCTAGKSCVPYLMPWKVTKVVNLRQLIRTGHFSSVNLRPNFVFASLKVTFFEECVH